MVFPKVNCPGRCAEGGQRIRGRGGIVLSAGTSNDAGYRAVCGIHSGVIVVVGGDFDFGWRHKTFISQ